MNASKRNETTYALGDPRTAENAVKGGSVSSPAKAATARENGKKGGIKSRPPADRECQCGMGDAVAPENHKYACPRSRAWRRQNAPRSP